MRRVLIAVLLMSGLIYADGGCSNGMALQQRTSGLTVIPNASVKVCANSVCNSLATLYVDSTLGTTTANPVIADARGNYNFCTNPGQYPVIVTNPADGTRYVISEVTVPSPGGTDTNAVHKTGNETVAGSKTFTDGITGSFTDSETLAITSTINTPAVFGLTPARTWCNIAISGGICYGLSSTVVDGTDGSGYTHSVAAQTTTQKMTVPGHGADVYGVAAGFTLAAGVHPGAGFRVEKQTGTTGSIQPGQVAAAFVSDWGVSPIALLAEAQCDAGNGNCNSQEINLTAQNPTPLPPWRLYSDYVGGLNFVSSTSDGVAFASGPINFYPVTAATATNNIDSPYFHLLANAWNGSAGATYGWRIQHQVNASGAISVDQLSVTPPTIGGVTPVFMLKAETDWYNGGIVAKVEQSGKGTFNGGLDTGTLATGTRPIITSSTTLNTNLNADLVDGLHAAAFPLMGVTPTINRATCWKTATTLGYCSTVVAADGSCTCN